MPPITDNFHVNELFCLFSIINLRSNNELNATAYKTSNTSNKIILLLFSKYKIDKGIHKDEKNKIETYKLINFLKFFVSKFDNFFIKRKKYEKVIYPIAPKSIEKTI